MSKNTLRASKNNERLLATLQLIAETLNTYDFTNKTKLLKEYGYHSELYNFLELKQAIYKNQFGFYRWNTVFIANNNLLKEVRIYMRDYWRKSKRKERLIKRTNSTPIESTRIDDQLMESINQAAKNIIPKQKTNKQYTLPRKKNGVYLYYKQIKLWLSIIIVGTFLLALILMRLWSLISSSFN